jgi:hypothetical protein
LQIIRNCICSEYRPRARDVLRNGRSRIRDIIVGQARA